MSAARRRKKARQGARGILEWLRAETGAVIVVTHGDPWATKLTFGENGEPLLRSDPMFKFVEESEEVTPEVWARYKRALP